MHIHTYRHIHLHAHILTYIYIYRERDRYIYIYIYIYYMALCHLRTVNFDGHIQIFLYIKNVMFLYPPNLLYARVNREASFSGLLALVKPLLFS